MTIEKGFKDAQSRGAMRRYYYMLIKNKNGNEKNTAEDAYYKIIRDIIANFKTPLHSFLNSEQIDSQQFSSQEYQKTIAELRQLYIDISNGRLFTYEKTELLSAMQKIINLSADSPVVAERLRSLVDDTTEKFYIECETLRQKLEEEQKHK